MTGFLPNNFGAKPIIQEYSGDRPAIELEQINSITFIIYMHGTSDSNIARDCSSASTHRIPDVLKHINERQVAIFYLCSSAIETLSIIPGSYIFNRMKELEVILDELLAQGAHPSQIILAGHSAGGWVSLMAAHRFQAKFAGSIAFAPAFAGKKSQASFWWRKIARPYQIKKMLSAEDMNALVFAYHNDPYEDPASLQFLVDKPNVRLVSFSCRFPHSAIFHGCESKETALNIEEFIKRTALLTRHPG